MVTAKAATLIFISGCGSTFQLLMKRIYFYNLVKEIISGLSAQTCAYFMKILTVYTMNSHLFTLKAHITNSRMVMSSVAISQRIFITNSEDTDQTAPVGAV